MQMSEAASQGGGHLCGARMLGVPMGGTLGACAHGVHNRWQHRARRGASPNRVSPRRASGEAARASQHVRVRMAWADGSSMVYYSSETAISYNPSPPSHLLSLSDTSARVWS